MSIILDAINRADQERSEANHTPSLHVDQSPPSASPSALHYKISLAVIILLTIMIISYVSFQYFNAPTQPLTTQSQPVVMPPKTIQTTPQPKAQQIASKNEQPISTQPIDSSAPTIASPQEKNHLTPPKSRISTQQEASISSLYAQPNIPAPSPKLAKTKHIENNSIAPTKKPSQPLLTELPWRTQQDIPSIEFSQHVYSQYPRESYVELNRLILKPGEQLAPGLRLIDIREDFIILDYQGTIFRLSALNSWINFN